FQTDVAAFETLLSKARSEPDAAVRAECVEEVLRLSAAPFLDGFDGDEMRGWVGDERDRLQVLRDDAEEMLRELRAGWPRAAAQAGTVLPNYLDVFVGRGADRAALARRLARERLVSLIGPGGIGKTRLAVEVIGNADVSGLFPDGVFFADVASL